MKAFLKLKRIKIENANAVSGLTYGFPSVTHFLGFTHALSRQVKSKGIELKFKGCAIVAHEQQIHKYSTGVWGDATFSLSRNPPGKDGLPAAFNEEGKMHLTVSLLIECDFDKDDLKYLNFSNEKEFEKLIKDIALTHRLAGGMIQDIEEIKFEEIPENLEKKSKFIRREMRKLLPGFLLIEKSDLLAEHLMQLKSECSEKDMMDSWLDFIALKFQAEKKEENPEKTEVEWSMVPKPSLGYLVPINIGYRAVSELYSPGTVKQVRDPTVPFRFVESVYTIGQWISPHRIEKLEEIFWQYQADPVLGWYICKNQLFSLGK